jgi:hypothetical protein
MLGGPDGHEVSVTAGDVLVLPLGTGHCRLEANADFLVVGAYLPNQTADLCHKAPTAAMIARMNGLSAAVPDPEADTKDGLQNYGDRSEPARCSSKATSSCHRGNKINDRPLPKKATSGNAAAISIRGAAECA